MDPGRSACRECLELHRRAEQLAAVLETDPILGGGSVNRATGPIAQVAAGFLTMEAMRYLTASEPPVAAATYQVLELADGMTTSRTAWARASAVPFMRDRGGSAMTDIDAASVVIGSASRFGELTAVRDGDGYVIGSPHSPDYLAVPEIGGQVVEWLRAGHEPGRCAELAEAAVGQPVDVARFIEVLDEAGLLAPEAASSDGPISRPVRGRRIGRFFFGPVGLTVQLGLGLVSLVLLMFGPTLRPTYCQDAFVVDSPLPAMLLLAAMGVAGGPSSTSWRTSWPQRDTACARGCRSVVGCTSSCTRRT